MRSALFAAVFTLAFASAQEDISRHVAPLERALKTSADPGLVMYGIARTYAAAGQSAPALEWLCQIVALNQDFDPSGDDAFDATRSTPEFRGLVKQIEKATPPVRRSSPAFTIADPDLISEGMAYDPVGRRFFLGSLSTHKILEITPEGKWRDFAAEGLHQVLGMKVDPATNTLWVADNGDNESAVLCYDLRPRKLVKRYAVPGTHTLNDLVVSPRGDVYITDTKTSVIYRIAGETATEFLKGLEYPNGIAISEDGSKLFIAHFGDGISLVDVETRADPESKASMKPLRRPLRALGGALRWYNRFGDCRNLLLVFRQSLGGNQIVLRQAFLQNFERGLGVVGVLEQIQVLLRYRPELHQRVEVHHPLPILAPVEHNHDFLRQLAGLGERQQLH